MQKILFLLLLIPCLTFPSPTEAETLQKIASDLQVSEDDAKVLMDFSKERNVPFPVVYQLLYVESRYDPQAVGPQTPYGRAYGIAQFMPDTAKWMAQMNGFSYDDKKLFDQVYSTKLSICYLQYLQYGDGKTHDGYHNWHKTLTAYNRGMYGLLVYERKYGKSESNYSTLVLKGLDSKIVSY